MKHLACEQWFTDSMTELPSGCVRWGPVDYTMANSYVMTVPKSDVVETLPSSGETADDDDTDDDDIATDATISTGHMIDATMTPKKMMSHSLAQNLGQGIDCAVKEASGSSSSSRHLPVFPVRTICLLSTGQRLLVHSVTIDDIGARPKIYYHGKCEVRVLPSLNYNLSAHTNLCVDDTVDKRQVERMLAAHVVCMLGVVDLCSDHHPTGRSNTETEDAYFKAK